jgi:hypothetical protein
MGPSFEKAVKQQLRRFFITRDLWTNQKNQTPGISLFKVTTPIATLIDRQPRDVQDARDGDK